MPKAFRSGISPAAERVPNRKALRASGPVDPTSLVALEGLRRLLPEPTPSPRLRINRRGATPSGHVHPNMPSPICSPKPDISMWQRIGHFYLALTLGLKLEPQKGPVEILKIDHAEKVPTEN